MNTHKKPKAACRGGDFGGDVEADAGNLPLPLDYSTIEDDNQTLTLGRALRLRDAMIILERRLLEVRTAFEADIAEALKGGVG